MTEKLTFGSDPEFFFLKEGKIVPPVFLLGEGEDIIWKTEFPYRVYSEQDNLKVTSDGAAFELVVNPTKDWEELYKNIQEGIKITENLVKNSEKGKNTELGIVPTAELPEEYHIQETLITGCDPDFDALNSEWYAKETIEDSPYRYAGAHIHIGFEDKDLKEHVQRNLVPFVQLLGIYVGIPGLLFSDEFNLELLRLKKYGKPAKYRIPEHGVEYRSTSNNWIKNIETAGILFENISRVVSLFKNKEKAAGILDMFVPPMARAFKEEDTETLQYLYNNAIKFI